MSDQLSTSPASSRAVLLDELSALLCSTLGLQPGALPALPELRILGAIPELDSMSVVTFLIGIEEQYDIVIHDDEVDAAVFETLGSMADFVWCKLG